VSFIRTIQRMTKEVPARLRRAIEEIAIAVGALQLGNLTAQGITGTVFGTTDTTLQELNGFTISASSGLTIQAATPVTVAGVTYQLAQLGAFAASFTQTGMVNTFQQTFAGTKFIAQQSASGGSRQVAIGLGNLNASGGIDIPAFQFSGWASSSSQYTSAYLVMYFATNTLVLSNVGVSNMAYGVVDNTGTRRTGQYFTNWDGTVFYGGLAVTAGSAPASGVTSIVAGTGISVSGSTTVTVTWNPIAGNGIAISGATITNNIAAGTNVTITGTSTLTINAVIPNPSTVTGGVGVVDEVTSASATTYTNGTAGTGSPAAISWPASPTIPALDVGDAVDFYLCGYVTTNLSNSGVVGVTWGGKSILPNVTVGNSGCSWMIRGKMIAVSSTTAHASVEVLAGSIAISENLYVNNGAATPAAGTAPTLITGLTLSGASQLAVLLGSPTTNGIVLMFGQIIVERHN